MDHEQPHQELVKCVVVGDTAVGKTRLICARACNQQMSLSQLLTTHVPTVWAIDQYRIYKEVLERSWHVVDNVNVSLRLWDTFGDHEKDRRFAYGHSDVVLLCFSIGNRISLRNCRLMWYHEIRKFCPNTPVILVGCKNDLRFIYRDKSYLNYYKERSPFIRLIKKSDLVMPEEARHLANELGLYYYETSVLTNYGVSDAFENAIRVALIARRQQHFWITNLKKVKWPQLQAPYMPPKPKLPEIRIEESRYDEHFRNLLTNRFFTDLILVIGNNSLEVHRFMMASTSKVFKRLLLMNFSNSDFFTRSSSESSLVSSLDDGEFESEENIFIRKSNKPSIKIWDQIKRHASHQMLTMIEKEKKNHLINREFNNHPIFKSIQVTNNFDFASLIHTANTIVITLSSVINWFALQQCVQFSYTGSIDFSMCDYSTLLETADIFEFHILIKFLKTLNPNNCEGTRLTADEPIRTAQKQQLYNLLEQNLFTDVVFKLDDTVYPVHKAVLVSRCDMMSAMLQGNFKESQAKVVLFPGIKEHAFHKLMSFFYTDDVPKIVTSHCLHVIELANRLCLSRLLNLIELRLVENFEKMTQHEHNLVDVLQTCLQLLEPVKFHNADQLAEWCLNFLCINYNTICKNLMKYFRQLNEDNQKFIIENRWPPIWYLKDYDLYHRCMLETFKEKSQLMKDKSKSGCLCFVKSKDTFSELGHNHLSVKNSDKFQQFMNEKSGISALMVVRRCGQEKCDPDSIYSNFRTN